MQTAVLKTNANHIDVGQGWTQQSYLDFIYRESTGFIAVGEKFLDKRGFKQWHYLKAALEDRFGPVEDTYITPNTFYKAKRTAATAREINMFYLDLDFYKTGLTKEQVLLKIKLDILPNHDIPMPTFIIDSGRGLYLQWKINKAQGKSKKVKHLWSKIQRVLIEAFEEVGVDSAVRDIPRFLRIPGSINSKNGQTVKILEFHNMIYELDDLQNKLLPEFEEAFPEYPSKTRKVTKKVKKEKRSSDSNILFMRTPQNLHYTRMKDLEKLVSLRKGDIKEGCKYRELLLFYYRYLAEIIHGKEKALEMAIKMNQSFEEPLEISEVENATKSTDMIARFKKGETIDFEGSVQATGYNYKNTTLIDIFDISKTEQRSLTTIIDKDEKQRRNTLYQAKKRGKRRNGELTPKQKEKEERREKIERMKSEGFTQQQIAETLGVSLATVKREWKVVKEKQELEMEIPIENNQMSIQREEYTVYLELENEASFHTPAESKGTGGFRNYFT